MAIAAIGITLHSAYKAPFISYLTPHTRDVQRHPSYATRCVWGRACTATAECTCTVRCGAAVQYMYVHEHATHKPTKHVYNIPTCPETESSCNMQDLAYTGISGGAVQSHPSNLTEVDSRATVGSDRARASCRPQPMPGRRFPEGPPAASADCKGRGQQLPRSVRSSSRNQRRVAPASASRR